ncbi:MAG: zinc-ribbon domain-containing protein [Ruminococcus sp.]
MYNNVGKKIKGIATIVSAIGMIASIILGITMLSHGSEIFNSLLVIAIGCLISWLGAINLYAFGQLVESAQNIEKKLFGDETAQVSTNEKKSVMEKINSRVNKAETGTTNSDNNYEAKSTKCPVCNTEVVSNAAFCPKCGSKMK